MIYQIVTDLIVILHLLFICFALAGGLLVLKWRHIAWLHLPAVLWAACIEFVGGICPLTPLENWLSARSGGSVYLLDFIEQYILKLIYPESLTPHMQIVLGLMVIFVNGVVYLWVWYGKKIGNRV
ncbi:MAG: DUF2784 domain-containing protein [Deltaproteobacteria bacterium]|nr:DUF2784 domain-containing protein [Deltaproteobacteria bacterium]